MPAGFMLHQISYDPEFNNSRSGDRRRDRIRATAVVYGEARQDQGRSCEVLLLSLTTVHSYMPLY